MCGAQDMHSPDITESEFEHAKGRSNKWSWRLRIHLSILSARFDDEDMAFKLWISPQSNLCLQVSHIGTNRIPLRTLILLKICWIHNQFIVTQFFTEKTELCGYICPSKLFLSVCEASGFLTIKKYHLVHLPMYSVFLT